MRTPIPKNQVRRPHACASLMLAALSLSLAPLPISAIAEEASHAHHHHAMPGKPDSYVRTRVAYSVPDVKLLDANGARVSLRSELADQDRPVILNFIFTSCTAICPVMTATFSEVQATLGPQRSAVRMVSISIDPEQDTPAVLKAYAGKFGAGPQWQMLTGSLHDSIAVQRAFNVYRGDKMGHSPATFLRAKAGQPWVRLEGFASANDILQEYRQLAAR
ncbi:MAG: SCO family protein [Rhodoferax sp.]|uniref:SCO family protein n=1 Tax=Rhodoferax sp. TaxID=50421 RepID=UPI002725A041|nr:SCO family protein [Rhodoferax sp.]MDO8448466.1 SCO family protein [Rhodoferax sp.]